MFHPQYIKDAAVFLMRYTTHNWSDPYVTKFLTRLREAARPDTQLVIVDGIADYLCRGSGDAEGIPGAAKEAAPEPLLPYPDSVIGWGYLMDLNVRTTLKLCIAMVLTTAVIDVGDDELPGAYRGRVREAAEGCRVEGRQNLPVRGPTASAAHLFSHLDQFRV